MKKRILALTLSLAVVVGLLAGCGNKETSQTQDPDPSQSAAAPQEETITLRIAHNYDFVTIPDAVIATSSLRRTISVSTGTSTART